MKVKAPFKLTYDGWGKIRCWGFGCGHLVGFPIRYGWSYSIGGHSWWLPLGVIWKRNFQIENAGNPNFGRRA